MNKQITLQEALNWFDLTINDIPNMDFSHMNIEQASKKLEEFKTCIKKAYRKAVFRFHPDHGGDKEKMQQLNEVYTTLMTLRIMRKPRPRPPVVRYYTYNHYGGTTSSTSNW